MQPFSSYGNSVTDSDLSEELEKALGKKVEVLAFGVAYVGKIKKVDLELGTIVIEDKNDSAVLEIERIEDFKILNR